MMRSAKNSFDPRNFSKCRYSAGISVLFIFLMGFGFQGCVIHSHGNHNAHYKTKTQSHKNYKHHKHQDAHYRKPAPKTVDKIPSYGEQHPSSHGQGHKVSKGKPLKGDDHPSQQAHNNHGQGANKGKPLKEEDRPSSRGKNHKKDLDKPDKESDHPSSHAQGNQGHNKDKEKPLWGDESISDHAKQEDVIEHSFSSQDEKIQIANAEPIQGKSNAKGFSKGKKINRGKHKKQTDKTPTVAHREPLPGVTPPQPAATTASYAPLVFDDNQRITIQGYYQKSGSKKSGKGRGKKSRGPKQNKTTTVSKNEIFTQPSKPLPQGLESQLPPPPQNAKRVLYHQQVLLIERSTNRVLDVINVNN